MKITEYHLWFNIILLLIVIFISIPFLFAGEFGNITFFFISPLLSFIGLITTVYYIIKKLDNHMKILSLLDLFYFPLILIAFYFISGFVTQDKSYSFNVSNYSSLIIIVISILTFIYALYLKWSIPEINKKR